MANEIIYSLGADSEKYTSIFPAINKWRKQARLPLIPHGEEIVVHAGQLHPVHENQIRSQMELPLIEVPEVTNTQPQRQEKRKKARKAGGRFGMYNNWVDYGQHYFSMSAGRVWYTIFRLADGNTNLVKFGYRSLAEKAGVGRNTAQRAISAFEKAGILVCVFKSPKQGVPSQYKLVDATNELTKQPPKPRRSRPQR